VEQISKYFPELSNEQNSKFRRLLEVYPEWNERINVISRKDIHNLETRHILHSLSIAKLISFAPGTEVLDIGTGGGFPGIPLSIMFPDSKFHLVDSVGKKIKVVEEIAAELGLGNVTAEQARAEQVTEKFDFVVSRAVSNLPEFYRLAEKNISNKHKNSLINGVLYLKGGDFGQELLPFRGRHQLFNISSYFSDEFFETKKIAHVWKNSNWQ
jgi:16S rRNA (guanine527-N7)-methyltransferase